MGMATGQGPIPETELIPEGENVKISKFQYTKKFPKLYISMYFMYESLLPYPYTKERKEKLQTL